MTKRLSDCTPEEAEALRQQAAAYYRKTKETQKVKAAERHKFRYANDPEYRARKDRQANEARIRKRYGISSEDQKEMLEAQGGKCKLCGSSSPKSVNWHTDHCHNSGKVRAMLCGPCNVFVGRIEKNPLLVQKALEYIKEHQ